MAIHESAKYLIEELATGLDLESDVPNMQQWQLFKNPGDSQLRWYKKQYVEGYKKNSYINRESSEIWDCKAWLKRRQVTLRHWNAKRVCWNCMRRVNVLWAKPDSQELDEEEYCIECVHLHLPKSTALRVGAKRKKEDNEDWPTIKGRNKRRKLKHEKSEANEAKLDPAVEPEEGGDNSIKINNN